ncbi:MAG: hypothetical protein AAGD07_05460, partial [Planctomycetota bacterium]
TNPYEPPRDEIRYASFGQRLRRGARLAIQEYKRGIQRDGMAGRQLSAWLSLFVVVWIAIWFLFISLATLVNNVSRL